MSFNLDNVFKLLSQYNILLPVFDGVKTYNVHEHVAAHFKKGANLLDTLTPKNNWTLLYQVAGAIFSFYSKSLKYPSLE